MSDKLIEFLTELTTNEKVKKQFLSDQTETMRDYGVPEEHIKMVVEKRYQDVIDTIGTNYRITINTIIDIFKIK